MEHKITLTRFGLLSTEDRRKGPVLSVASLLLLAIGIATVILAFNYLWSSVRLNQILVVIIDLIGVGFCLVSYLCSQRPDRVRFGSWIITLYLCALITFNTYSGDTVRPNTIFFLTVITLSLFLLPGWATLGFSLFGLVLSIMTYLFPVNPIRGQMAGPVAWQHSILSPSVTWALVLLVPALLGFYLLLQVRRSHALVLMQNKRLNEAMIENQRLEMARQLTEDRLKESEARLRQAAKMETVGRLAGGVAHDFNNFLTAILGYSELAAFKLGQANPVYNYLQEINQAANRASGLTSQLLTFSRKQSLSPQSLHLNEVINQADKLLCRLIGEDIEISHDLDPNLGLIMADPVQLEQVILNLALNARDAMPHGGKLTIKTLNTTLEEGSIVLQPGMSPGEYIQMILSDTGIGMDQATTKHIFEPFFTTKETGKGTGLGLAMVNTIVQQNGGLISVSSKPGKGTSFTIYLPHLQASCLPEVCPAPGHSTTPEQGTGNILLVEDDAAVRSLTEHLLTARGYNVTAASKGSYALALFPQLDTTPDLLITDVIMPGMTGRDLASHLQTLQPGLKVLYLSGYTDQSIVAQDGLEHGWAFLQKPFTPEQLATQVRSTLASRRN
ncbi:MAG: domain S-box-containing protein [Chloroflexi bacterium]|nr:domain S-box-containing protein [Chloroflexota bacterium]